MEPNWLDIDLVLVLHREAVSRFGGSDGVRDMGLLESALERPHNLCFYGDEPTLFDLAAAYSTGIVKNPPFLDGNKRTGLLRARAFLCRNDSLFESTEVDQVTMIAALAAGDIDENELTGWIADFTIRKT